MSEPKKVLSCIQPTGNLHFGRYFGAIQNWVNLQSSYDCLYGIVNYHAMTMPYNIKKLIPNTWELAFNLVACGIEPERIFIQSLIPEHAELSWIFNTMTSYGELSRMTQFKDKSNQVKETSKDVLISSALYTYPVLQAADILIYKADFVPVGKDQEQHLELTRNIGQRFNHHTGKDYFVLPEPLFTEIPKVMSTADPNRKMSASLGEKHNIDLFADPQKIRKQIRSAVTDTGDGPRDQMSAGIENLFGLLKAAGDHEEYDEMFKSYYDGTLQYGHLKEVVGEALVQVASPIQERKAAILTNKKSMKEKIRDSSRQIRLRAQQTLHEVKDLVGLLNPRL